jgi:XTP/dITP diphosphohydrolase
MKILFATSNPNKLKEANDVGKGYGIEFVQLKQPYPEIRDEDVAKVAEDGAKHVYGIVKKPLVVDDTGLYIDALNGFPGPYSAYVFKKIGCPGILRLMKGIDNRNAVFVSAVGWCDGKTLSVYRGECSGTIIEEMRGPQVFGYDPIFLPEGQKKTFAEDAITKDLVSHRRKSFEAFCEWFVNKKTGK